MDESERRALGEIVERLKSDPVEKNIKAIAEVRKSIEEEIERAQEEIATLEEIECKLGETGVTQEIEDELDDMSDRPDARDKAAWEAGKLKVIEMAKADPEGILLDDSFYKVRADGDIDMFNGFSTFTTARSEFVENLDEYEDDFADPLRTLLAKHPAP
jgi:hypothetical protein